MSERFDYLIIGQGLAGTCLAFTLQEKFSKKVLVIDELSGSECSAIAAGTFNPLVFRTFKPTWRSPEFIPFLNDFYRKAEAGRNLNLVNKRSVLKILKNEEQRKFWVEKSSEITSSPFMDDKILASKSGIESEHGLGRVLQSGNINMKEFLSGFRDSLKEKDCIIKEEFDHSALQSSDNSWHYKGIICGKVVFCEGHRTSRNPYFRDLPFRQTKGEVLIIRCPNLKSDDIIHNNINIVPMGNDHYWVGSTFDWQTLDTEVTDMGKSRLSDQLKECLNVEFEVVDHKAGIRPTVKDRRPLLGEHEVHKNMYIFNGMGTRGVMLAPFFADHLAEHMENGSDLDTEVDIRRFTSKE